MSRASHRADAIVEAPDSVISRPVTAESKLFALLIGVDEYQVSWRNLSGAVNDAKKIETFLLSQQPPVSKDRIISLKNGGATADGIIRCIEYLCDAELTSDTHGEEQDKRPAMTTEVQEAIRGKEQPERDDPILIYYAGHGSRLAKPAGWDSENEYIQCISPHNAGIGADKSVINVIPDRTFGALLGRLAEAKGNNITVILDCCHSGSGTRDDAVPRGMEFKDGDTELTISPTYQQEFWTPPIDSARGVMYLPQFANSGLSSHVVLAACGPNESAYEDPMKHEGRFTSAFLNVLKEAGTDTLTYAELIRRLDSLPSQTPRCEGRDKEVRILFDAGLKQRDRDSHPIKLCDSPSPTPYSIPVGQVHGVGKGDAFDIYRDRDTFTSGGKALGSVVVNSVTPDSSFVSLVDGSVLDASTVTTSVAVLSRVRSPDAFRVNVAINEANYPELRKEVDAALQQVVRESADASSSDGSPDSIGLSIAGATSRNAGSSVDKASISIIPARVDLVYFEFCDGNIRETLGLERLCGPIKGNRQTLVSALRSAAHFFRHLGSSPSPFSLPDALSPISTILLRDQVDVRICELQGSLGLSNEGVLVNQLRPSGKVIDAKQCGMFKPTLSRVSDLNPTQTLYGVDVRNGSGVSLYVWLFYFDCSTLEIAEYYSPPVVADKGDPPLSAQMQAPMPLNYGDAGGIPLAFEVPKGMTLDGGFLRVFLSTRHLDLSNIRQGAVVRPGEAMGLVHMKNLLPVEDLWDAITIPVKLI